MLITHEEAHRLIQFDTDHALKSHEKNDLVAHLEACEECKSYAESMKGIESLLRPFFHRNWNKQPIPLSLATLTGKITGKRNQGLTPSAFMATRIAIIGVICMGFVFSVWQFTSSPQATPVVSMIGVPPMPTPSTQFIRATSTISSCVGRTYVVKERDTVESIAQFFLLEKGDILAANEVSKESIKPGMEIIIPACTSTPTGTVNAQTTTYTPSTRPITSTPGG